jgi:hypothetical protein
MKQPIEYANAHRVRPVTVPPRRTSGPNHETQRRINRQSLYHTELTPRERGRFFVAAEAARIRKTRGSRPLTVREAQILLTDELAR